MLRRRLPERVAGKAWCRIVRQTSPLRVFLLGRGGRGGSCRERIHQNWPGVQVVGTDSPPLGFENDSAENARILARNQRGRADADRWLRCAGKAVGASSSAGAECKVALCRCDDRFPCRQSRRSPVWMQRVGLEWVHRVASEPRHACRTPATRGFPQLLWRENGGGSILDRTRPYIRDHA
jgi:N-acetylglucosaminyldiphosphoundecaprenol N-acetyl-beta-D-mannosaminyltransferase